MYTKRTYHNVPIGQCKRDGEIVPMHELDQAKLPVCTNCGSSNMDDLAFSRQRGYFQDVCVAILQCNDCGEIHGRLWAEDKPGGV